LERRVKLLEKAGGRIELLYEGYPPEVVNAIRRAAMAEVPTLAVDFIYVYDNSSSVFDEIIAHRMGLTVLDSSEALETLRPPEECKGASEDDESCYVELILESSVPDDAATGRYVKAGEIKVTRGRARIVYPETPIAYLAPGQKVHIVAYARLGRGREHGKWSPVSVAASQYMPVIEYDGSKASKECIECVSHFEELRRALEGGGSGTIELARNTNTSGIRYCAENVCGDALSIRYDDTRIILALESTGTLPPERIVLEAIKELERRALQLKSRLQEAKG